MALKTKKGSDLPSGAVTITEEVALERQWSFIKKWPSETEVLFLKFGSHIVSASTLFSSYSICSYFKKVLNISNARFALGLFPAMFIPTFLSNLATDYLITNPTLLMKFRCAVCEQLKFGAVQLYFSIVFPATYGYFSMVTFATLTQSYKIPHITKDAREFWRITGVIFKQGSARFQALGLAQSVLILFLPYIQNKQFYNIMTKYEQKNRELNSELLV